MRHVRFTLLTDGSSDRALIPILTWLLRQHLPESTFEYDWPDLRRHPRPPKTLATRVRLAIELAPCDLLFIQRDAERQPIERRLDEISQAIGGIQEAPPFVHVVPVRMVEAWLLTDEPALRIAAGNPNGRMPLGLPHPRDIEGLPDPKTLLNGLLRQASGLNDRRWRKQSAAAMAFRVAELIDDFAPLRALPAFAALETEVQRWAANR